MFVMALTFSEKVILKSSKSQEKDKSFLQSSSNKKFQISFKFFTYRSNSTILASTKCYLFQSKNTAAGDIHLVSSPLP